jgi:type I site-specific restriction endonuclease
MNEAETRAEHIDPALKAAGCGVVEGSRIRREYPITLGRIEGLGKRGKALTADYLLEYRNTKLAIVEAKAWDKPLTEGVGQAKVSSQCALPIQPMVKGFIRLIWDSFPIILMNPMGAMRIMGIIGKNLK